MKVDKMIKVLLQLERDFPGIEISVFMPNSDGVSKVFIAQVAIVEGEPWAQLRGVGDQLEMDSLLAQMKKDGLRTQTINLSDPLPGNVD